ncbi:hypothetical protein ACIOK4_13475 [Streptomyces bottropensis]|uniref:hypothetical protein n=1 Tax=Streptomyces bottropensis TaxID=42235 RepID=UPI003810B1A0
MSGRKRILIDAPSEMTILAARHLDATEGPVQTGSIVDTSARSAITTVLRYIATAHNAPPVADEKGAPRRPCRYCPDPLCPEDCPECGSPIHDLDAVPAQHQPDVHPEEQQRTRADNAEERLRLAREALARDGYFTADEIGDDIAPRITELSNARIEETRELIKERALLWRRAAEAEVEVARLRAGEEPGWDPAAVPTPGQWIARWNRASAAERLDVAERVIGNAQKAGKCFEMNHAARLEDDREALVALARVRELRDKWLPMTLESGQVRRLLDGITRALEGQRQDGTVCDVYKPPSTSADSGLCARCGMSDYRHPEAS